MKISIITATWNSASTVEDTIKSVLMQTYKDYEYIVVDGGSKDNTMDIVCQYEARFDGKLKWISEPDRGIYDAMNKGIGMATGDVVGILNSDDFYTDGSVLDVVAKTFNENGNLDAVYGDIHFVKPDNLRKCTRYFSSRYFRPWMFRFGFMPAHPSFYCRKDVFDKYGLYDLKYKTSSDFDMMVRLFVEHGIKALYVNKDFVTMRMGGESTAGLASKKKVNNDIAESLRAHGIYSNQLFQYARYAWRLCELLYTRIRY